MPSTRPATSARRRLTVALSALTLTVLFPAPSVSAGDLGLQPARAALPDRPSIERRAGDDRVDDGLLLDGVGAGLPSDGMPRLPSRDVKSVLRAQSDAAGVSGGSRAAAAVPAFATLGYVQQPIPAAAHPYALAAAVSLVDTGVHDADGVRMIRIGTKLFDHPVAQAQYGLANVASFDLTTDTRYLDRAIAQATRLVDAKVVSRDAWYFPYPFDFALHGRVAETMRARHQWPAGGIAARLKQLLRHWTAGGLIRDEEVRRALLRERSAEALFERLAAA